MRLMSDDLRPIAEGRHLGLWCRDGWEFARRRQGRGVVAIVALTTDRHLVLIEQHRVPLGASVIELPAGLVGDGAAGTDESIFDAARRELLEETGLALDHWSDEVVEVTVDHCGQGEAEPDAMVGQTALWIVVGPDAFGAVARADLAFTLGGVFGVLILEEAKKVVVLPWQPRVATTGWRRHG